MHERSMLISFDCRYGMCLQQRGLVPLIAMHGLGRCFALFFFTTIEATTIAVPNIGKIFADIGLCNSAHAAQI